jgi:hypothetical protein
VFFPFERDQIQQIPLIMEQNEDQLMWPHTKEGSYTVKSGYNMIKLWQDNANLASTSANSLNNKLWKTLWSLHTIPRHKVLLWRIMQQAIPVKQALSNRGIQGQTLCPRCLQKEETIEHVFKDCQHADRIWFGSKLGIRFSSVQSSFRDWLIYAFHNLNNEDLSYVAAICYGIWYARNQQVFEHRHIEEHETISKAQISLQEFTLAQLTTHNNTSGNTLNQDSRSSNNQSYTRRSNAPKNWKNLDLTLLKLTVMLTWLDLVDGVWEQRIEILMENSLQLLLGNGRVVMTLSLPKHVRCTMRFC